MPDNARLMDDPITHARSLALRLTHDLEGRGVGPVLARELGVSRQVANGHLQRLVNDRLLAAVGSTRARQYHLVDLATGAATYSPDGLEEDVVWRQLLAQPLADLPENVRRIWQYSFTEMLNNAIDHSGADSITVSYRMTGYDTTVVVSDDGEGIFRRIQRALGLTEPREAILELAKGKLTTAPERHSGEGIFFTSRMLDTFDIHSGDLHFVHRNGRPDVLAGQQDAIEGTLVTMNTPNDSTRTMAQVFDEFADPEEASFERTVVPVRLAQEHGDLLVSRSQARRIANRFDRFRHVEIDFEGVDEIGQAFADELFRVFPKDHADTRLVPVNAAPAVDRMIRHVTARP